MAETEQKIGSQSEETSGDGTTQQEGTISMSAYKTLQRDYQKVKDVVKGYEAKQREGQSVEEALQFERERAKSLEQDLQVERVKRTTPLELHDVIDNFVNKHGFVPDEEDLELLTSKFQKTETPKEDTSVGSSGVRNSPASKSTKPDFGSDDYLKSISLDQIKG